MRNAQLGEEKKDEGEDGFGVGSLWGLNDIILCIKFEMRTETEIGSGNHIRVILNSLNTDHRVLSYTLLQVE